MLRTSARLPRAPRCRTAPTEHAAAGVATDSNCPAHSHAGRTMNGATDLCVLIHFGAALCSLRLRTLRSASQACLPYMQTLGYTQMTAREAMHHRGPVPSGDLKDGSTPHMRLRPGPMPARSQITKALGPCSAALQLHGLRIAAPAAGRGLFLSSPKPQAAAARSEALRIRPPSPQPWRPRHTGRRAPAPRR